MRVELCLTGLLFALLGLEIGSALAFTGVVSLTLEWSLVGIWKTGGGPGGLVRGKGPESARVRVPELREARQRGSDLGGFGVARGAS